jgi:hypothetical protein
MKIQTQQSFNIHSTWKYKHSKVLTYSRENSEHFFIFAKSSFKTFSYSIKQILLLAQCFTQLLITLNNSKLFKRRMMQTVSMKKGQCVKNSSLTSVKKCRRLTSSWSVMTTSGMLMTGFSKASKSGLTGVEKRRTLAPRPPGCQTGKGLKVALHCVCQGHWVKNRVEPGICYLGDKPRSL